MPKYRKAPDFDCLEHFEKLQTLLEMAKLPLAKSITKGTKQAGINARKMLREAQIMIRDIIDINLEKQREVRANRPPHGNANGPGIKAMQEARRRQLENKKKKTAE